MIVQPARKLFGAVSDRYWQLFTAAAPPAESIWQLPEKQLRESIVVWPRHYQWPPAERWVSHLRQGLGARLTLVTAEIPQPYPGIVLFRVVVQGRPVQVAIDYSDYSLIDERCAEQVAVYFKMQFDAAGYRWHHVAPGGFVPGAGLVYQAIPRLRAPHDRGEYRHEVYGRFGDGFAFATRSKAVGILSAQQRFRYSGGLGRVRYTEYLREIADSRICIDLPGNGDFCFRLIDYLAIGTCVIALKPANILHVPLVDREHIVYMRDDMSDLVDLCAYYLEDDAARERIRRNATQFFDRYLHRTRLAEYYLQRILGETARPEPGGPKTVEL